MHNPKLKTLTAGIKNGMFAKRDTIPEAYEYAMSVARACGKNNEIGVITAVHVLLNTIANVIEQNNTSENNGWLVNTSDDGQYLYVRRDGAPGQIHIKTEDEGFVVDAWTDDEEPEIVGTMAVEYMQLERK